MKQLTLYLNGLTKQEQAYFAERCGTSVGYMRKVCSMGGLLREKVCALAEAHSAGAVTRKDLRPDDWAEIWPELRAVQANTTTEAANA